MKNISNLTQPEVDPFDAPVPGQSLTDEPGNYPWEHPPQFSDPEEVLDILFDKLGEPEVVEQVIAMLDSGVPVEAIVRVMTFSGFMNGKFNPDVGFLIVQPLMNMVSAIGIRAGISKLKLSLEDLSNDDFITSMVELKEARSKIENIAQDITEDTPASKPEGGLLSRPTTEEE
tara:strand:- start:5475 stop:5993 length:519 start_codon:yes stop_codon:yes gene_type:complete